MTDHIHTRGVAGRCAFVGCEAQTDGAAHVTDAIYCAEHCSECKPAEHLGGPVAATIAGEQAELFSERKV